MIQHFFNFLHFSKKGICKVFISAGPRSAAPTFDQNWTFLFQDERLFLNLISEILNEAFREAQNLFVDIRVSVGLGQDRFVGGLGSQYVIIYLKVRLSLVMLYKVAAQN